ncbi:MAG: hypothetical protein ACR2NV_10880 [Thermoleophilaceae bacterium]
MNEKLKKILSGVGLLAAFGLGGAAIAGAQGGNPVAGKPDSTQTAPARPEAAEPGEGKETDQKVTGADADRAGRAAARSVGGGKVLEVEKETPDQGADKPESGDRPDSAKEQAIDQKTAYSVEVQKGEGATVDVALDDTFNVLGSEQDTEGSSEQGEAGEAR